MTRVNTSKGEEIGSHDVILGRGKNSHNHVGNVKYREFVDSSRWRYLACGKKQKPEIVRELVMTWRQLDPPGRFLAQDEETGEFYEVGNKRAEQKTSQRLRERNSVEVSAFYKFKNAKEEAVRMKILSARQTIREKKMSVGGKQQDPDRQVHVDSKQRQCRHPSLPRQYLQTRAASIQMQRARAIYAPSESIPRASSMMAEHSTMVARQPPRGPPLSTANNNAPPRYFTQSTADAHPRNLARPVGPRPSGIPPAPLRMQQHSLSLSPSIMGSIDLLLEREKEIKKKNIEAEILRSGSFLAPTYTSPFLYARAMAPSQTLVARTPAAGLAHEHALLHEEILASLSLRPRLVPPTSSVLLRNAALF